MPGSREVQWVGSGIAAKAKVPCISKWRYNNLVSEIGIGIGIGCLSSPG